MSSLQIENFVKIFTINLRTKDAPKTKEFYILFMYQALCILNMMILNSTGKTFGQIYIKDDHFFAVVAVGQCIANITSRITWSIIMDYTSFKVCMYCMTH